MSGGQLFTPNGSLSKAGMITFITESCEFIVHEGCNQIVNLADKCIELCQCMVVVQHETPCGNTCHMKSSLLAVSNEFKLIV
jgi:hypothetical protein